MPVETLAITAGPIPVKRNFYRAGLADEDLVAKELSNHGAEEEVRLEPLSSAINQCYKPSDSFSSFLLLSSVRHPWTEAVRKVQYPAQ